MFFLFVVHIFVFFDVFVAFGPHFCFFRCFFGCWSNFFVQGFLVFGPNFWCFTFFVFNLNYFEIVQK